MPLLIFIYSMQMWALLTRSHYRVCDTQVTVKAHGPLVQLKSCTMWPQQFSYFRLNKYLKTIIHWTLYYMHDCAIFVTIVEILHRLLGNCMVFKLLARSSHRFIQTFHKSPCQKNSVVSQCYMNINTAAHIYSLLWSMYDKRLHVNQSQGHHTL